MVYMLLQTPGIANNPTENRQINKYLLTSMTDPLSLKSALPQFESEKFTHIFLPINNNHDPTIAEGGDHWSLLVISVVDSLAFHYDSLHQTNQREALVTTEKMSTILNKRIQFIDVIDTPQQNNVSDCGVHVCITMEYLLLHRLLTAMEFTAVDMGLKGMSWDCDNVRKDMLGIIKTLRRRATRSRSPALNGRDGSAPRIE